MNKQNGRVGEFTHGGRRVREEETGLEANVPFHFVITFESYSVLFKNKTKQSIGCLVAGRRLGQMV